MSQGSKLDNGKEPLDLIPYESLKEIAKVLDFGAKKYARANWAQGIEFSRLIAATLRHVNQFNSGEDLDPETQLNHLAHAGCEILFLLYLAKHRPDLDDRWTKLVKKPEALGYQGAKIVAEAGLGGSFQRSLTPGVDEALQVVADARYAGVEKKPLKLKTGKRYKRRDGKVVTVENRTNINSALPAFTFIELGHNCMSYRPDGRFRLGESDCAYDLVEEA